MTSIRCLECSLFVITTIWTSYVRLFELFTALTHNQVWKFYLFMTSPPPSCPTFRMSFLWYWHIFWYFIASLAHMQFHIQKKVISLICDLTFFLQVFVKTLKFFWFFNNIKSNVFGSFQKFCV